MKIDPLDVVANALSAPLLRFLFAWLCGTVGAFIPLFISYGISAFHVLGWQALLFPAYLLYMALDSGWWTIVSIPLLILLAWRMIEFMRNENTGSDLFAIFTISYLIGIRAIGSYWPFGFIPGAGFIYLMIVFDRRDRSNDPT